MTLFSDRYSDKGALDDRPNGRKFLTVGMILALAVVGCGIAAGGFVFGRRQEAAARKIVWLSDVTALNGGPRRYFWATEVKCPGGQSLGQIILDVNLTNGRVRVVRNDVGEYPVCPAEAPAPAKPATPAATPEPIKPGKAKK